MDKEGLEEIIKKVKSFVEGLSDESEKNKAAKRCVSRITNPDYAYSDQTSQVSTKQLLALTFLATQDDKKRIGTIEDACTQFVEGLYEIQRGYNISDKGKDDGGETDRLICPAGTFNKLIEKLQGIHPDCQIRYITRETATLKLPIVVREDAMKHIKSLANPNTIEELQKFTGLISKIKEDGVEEIWDNIKDNVADRMFDEFGSLYTDRENNGFTDLIEAGVYTDLPDLRIFQEQIENSKGYHQFCRLTLRQTAIFFSQTTSDGHPSSQSNNGSEGQREDDQQFGLVV